LMVFDGFWWFLCVIKNVMPMHLTWISRRPMEPLHSNCFAISHIARSQVVITPLVLGTNPGRAEKRSMSTWASPSPDGGAHNATLCTSQPFNTPEINRYIDINEYR
jgi:hypothetical protein